MTTPYKELSDLDVLRVAERERSKAIAAFFTQLFTKRDRQTTDYSGDVVAAE